MAAPEQGGGFARFIQSPFGRNISLAGGAALVASLIAAVYFWSQQPDYRVLFSNFSDRDGGAIVSALQQMNVQYKFAEGGGAILVPASQVHEARLKLAAQGLPKGGNVGFELMENQKLGVSQFLEQVNFQRALEGELARSIQSISSVQSARVHLALPKSSVFIQEQQKPTASVIINLYPGRTLEPQQVTAIVHLVSSSVPELSTGNVSIIDQNGNLLSDPVKPKANHSNLDQSQIKYVEEVQRDIVNRIESIIAPIMGAKNVHAEAMAEVDFSSVEQAAELYGPNQPPKPAAVRSQRTEDSGQSEPPASGVPGALSNQPPGSTVPTLPPLPGQSAAAAGHHEATTNFEVDKTVKYVKQPMGGIKRLSVAVVLNYKNEVDKTGKVVARPLTADEKAQITDLVKEAMGYDKDRGDSLNVVNSPFAGPEKELIPEVPFWKKAETLDLAKEIGKEVLAALVTLYLFFTFLRPILRRLSAFLRRMAEGSPAPVASDRSAPQQGQDDGDAAAQQSQAPFSAVTYEQKLDVAKKLAKENPREVANLIGKWVNGNE